MVERLVGGKMRSQLWVKVANNPNSQWFVHVAWFSWNVVAGSLSLRQHATRVQHSHDIVYHALHWHGYPYEGHRTAGRFCIQSRP